ncbi:uncharacterized protein LOC34621312 [Cyclospora cayetanensis]|uniref:Uncharacterized protein LOC34621312 n=1 Tax=Cyclospora cayetanensis TaxID=88456 RepID=A0A6P6S2T2_9EIME|nr:uncharacterized protein LOC34621312 [Cyclospora cayetanensis]
MLRDSSYAAVFAVAASLLLLLPLLLLQGLQDASAMRVCRSGYRGALRPGPPLSLGFLVVFPPSGVSPVHSRRQQLPNPLKTVARFGATAGSSAISSEEGPPGGGPQGALSERLDSAANARLRKAISAAEKEQDPIVCISAKDQDAETAAAAAASGRLTGTPDSLAEAARTFHLGGPLVKGPLAGRGPLGGPQEQPKMRPGGPLEALALTMQGGLERGGVWLRRWPRDEERVLPILLSRLEENAAVTLGQKTVIQLPEAQRMSFVESIRSVRAAAIVLGYADTEEDAVEAATAAGAAKAEGAGGTPAENIVLVGFAAVAEPIDVQFLDSSGEVGLRIVGRIKVLGVQEADEKGFKVRAVPWWDEPKDFENPSGVRETLGALHSLYDRCNKLELKYRQLQGRFNQAHLVSLRPSLGSTVSEHLADLESPSEQQIAEVVSFCALDHHLDARTRCWANSQQDTEVRLDLVRRALEAKVAKLQAEIKGLRAMQQIPGAAAAASEGGPPLHPAAPLGIHREDPEDIYAGPPATYG